MRPPAWKPSLRRLRVQFALIIAISMAPAGLLAALQAVSNANGALEQRESLLASEMRNTAFEERDVLNRVRSTLVTAARSVEREILNEGSCRQTLGDLVAEDPMLRRAVVLDLKGAPVCGLDDPFNPVRPSEWRDFSARPRLVLGTPRTSPPEKPAFVPAYYPLPAGRPEAFALAVGVDHEILRRLAASDGRVHPFGLVDESGNLIADNRAARETWLPASRTALLGAIDRTVRGTSADGERRLFFTHPVLPGQLWAVTSAPRQSLADIMTSREGFAILWPILLWMLAVAVAYVTIDRLVTRHLAYLQRVAVRLGRGEFNADIEPLYGAPTEIRRLGDAIRIMARNLTERDARLRELIAIQKSLLLEVHHRVKNNLQMISSLMNIQLRRSTDLDGQQVLRLVQDRIHSLALVHQHLYAADKFDHLALDRLCRDLCDNLHVSLKPAGAEVDFAYALEPVTVEAEIATPVALFLTEAITNVFKHAVAGHQRHSVRVALRLAGEAFELSIANPVPEAAQRPRPPAGRQRLGSRLMDSFATQLGGSCERSDAGGEFRITLRAPVASRAHGFAIRRPQAGAHVPLLHQAPTGAAR